MSESWQQVALRLDFSHLESGHPRDIRRAISEVWEDKSRPDESEAVIVHSVAAQRKSYDRAIVFAYLRLLPTKHPHFDSLARGAAQAANRHDWPWAERGRSWSLWDHAVGANLLASALINCEDPRSVLADAGLDGDLAEGAFLTAGLDAACSLAAHASGGEAERLGAALIRLFDQLGLRSSDAMLVYALLHPWIVESPSIAYRQAMSSLLVKRVGDPRVALPAWSVIERDLERRLPMLDVGTMLAVLRRWITETTVREFFKVIARTTDNPHQWKYRTAFWTAFLDHGDIDDAWFVLGPRANELFRRMPDWDEQMPHGRIRSGDGGAGHSALIMQIGDLRIAEWSDNGACRFWPRGHPDAPHLGQKLYYRSKLKMRHGSGGFESIAHLPSPVGWQEKFARLIHQHTGVRHPGPETRMPTPRSWR